MLNEMSSDGAVDDAKPAGDEEAVGAGVDTGADVEAVAEAGTDADAVVEEDADLSRRVVAAKEGVLLADGGGAEWM